MDFITSNILLIFVALTSAGMLFWNATQGGTGGANAISANDMVLAINREKATVIDIEEQATESIKGAKRIALADLEAKLASAVKNKANPVIFVCARGNRAKTAVAMAQKLGYEQARLLAGGLQAWKAANMPVIKVETV